jgi:hypothetical protein
MFDGLRQSLRDVLAAATSPAERREGLARMKETLALARVGLDDLRRGIQETRSRVVVEQRELETVRRRRGLAAGIGDAETVAIAERYERQHAERVAVLERKLDAQERELALAETEVTAMGAELKAAIAGVPPTGTVPHSSASEMPDEREAAEQELDALGRARRRAAKDAAAEDRLAALKRRMGK